MSAWSAASLHEIERVRMPEEGVEWIPVRAHFDIRAFGVNAWAGGVGSELVGPHDETDDFAGGHEELYLVVSGGAEFVVGDEVVDAPAGTILFVPDLALRRGAHAREHGTVVLTIGSATGTAFSVAAWEFVVRASERARDGDLELLRQGLGECPGSAELFYHLACYESLAGRLDEARAHLDEALARDSMNRERARREPDFEALAGPDSRCPSSPVGRSRARRRAARPSL